MPLRFAWSKDHEQTLNRTVFSVLGPGTIVTDFNTALDYIAGRLAVTPAGQLPLKAARALNERLARPVRLGLKRPQTKSYPPVLGLFLLLRASGLTRLDQRKKTAVLLPDPAFYEAWTTLNPAEQYGVLLEAWLLRGYGEIIGEHDPLYFSIPEHFHSCRCFFEEIPDTGLQVAGNGEAEDRLGYTPGRHNLGLLQLFGLIEIQDGPAEPGERWRIERITRTALGDGLILGLDGMFFRDTEKLVALDNDDKAFGALQAVLQPYFSDWIRNMTPPVPIAREGNHLFSVSFKEMRRRIAVPAAANLDVLAYAILDAVDFDYDHLYRFIYRNRFGVEKHINHPELMEGPYTDRETVGEVPIRIGEIMTFFYDFGDSWSFDVTLEHVDVDTTSDGAGLVDSKGKAPKQYDAPDDVF